MKKKLLTALLIAVVAVVPTMTVFAAPGNPSAEGETFEILEAYDADGRLIEAPQVLRIRELLESQKPAVAEIEKAENLKKLLGDKYSDTLQIIEEYDVYIYDVPEKTEIEWNSPECEIKFPVTITFNVPGVKADTELYVLHSHDGLSLDEWHVMDIKSIEDGKVTVTFTHLGGPLVFLTKNAAGNEGTTDGPASPGTGESNVALCVAIIVVAAATVAVVTRKKMA